MTQLDSIRQSRYQENAFLGFWVVVCLVCLVLFFKTEYQVSFSHDQKQIGKIDQLFERAKVKGDSSLSWFQASPGLALHNLDQIYTHEGAKLELELFESGKLVVFENTLLRLVETQGRTSIDLGQGLVTAQLSDQLSASRPMVISLNGKIYELKSQDAEIQIMNDQKSANIQVLTGTLELSSDQETISIQSDQQVQIRDDQVSREQLLEVSLLAPFQDQVFFAQKEKNIFFEWATSEEVVFKLARDPVFRRAVQSSVFSKQQHSLDLSPGVYYWRIENLDGTMTGQVQRFEIKEERAPRWTSPTNLNTSLRLERSQNDSKQLPLSWQAEGQRFQLQVGRIDPQVGVNWFIDQVIDRSVFELSLDRRGEYLARVKVADDGRDQALWSHDIFFRVWSNELRAPRRLMPQDHSKFIIFEQNATQKVSWRPVAGVERYELRWTSPDSVEHSQLVSDTHYDLPLQGAGSYQWQVRSVDGQESSSFSRVYKFEIQKEDFNPSTPENGLLIELDRPDQKVRFEWARAQGVKQYIFEMSPDPHFDQLSFVQAGKLPRIEISMPAIGTYYWRTKVVTTDGQEYFSRPYKVTVEPTAPPRRPKMRGRLKIEYLRGGVSPSFWQSLSDLIFARAQASDEVSLSDLEIKISWPAASEQVKAYQMRIYQQDQAPIVDLIVTEPFYIWSEAFEGEFFWEIAYIDYWDRVGPFSEPEVFTVTKRQEQKEIKFSDVQQLQLIRPRHALKIPDQAEVLFEWRVVPSDARVDSYLIEIATDLGFNHPVFTQSIGPKARQFIWKRPKDVKAPYFWRISSVQGEIKTTSLRRRLDHLGKVRSTVAKKERQKDKQKDETTTPKGSLAIFYQLGNLDFEQKSKEGPLEVSGLSIMGFRMQGQHQRYHYLLENNGGEVFDQEKFRKTSASFAYRFKEEDFGLSTSVLAKILRSSFYQLNAESNIIEESTKNEFAAGVMFRYLQPNWEVEARGVFGGFQELGVDGFWHGRWLSVGAGLENISLSDERDVFATKLYFGHRRSY